MLVIHINRDDLALCACLWAHPRRTMVAFVHDMLLGSGLLHTPRNTSKNGHRATPDALLCSLGNPVMSQLEALSFRDTLYLPMTHG
jgi:hypothetical protein